MVIAVLSILFVASLIYWLVAGALVRSFFLNRQVATGDFTPPISILKPLRGLDAQIYENFRTFCNQDYPDYELLFGVSDPNDPVIEVVERLQNEFPERDIRLVVKPARWVNRKASQLHSLVACARHQILVISDSDMRVTPDYLRRVVAPLADPNVGLVTCLYRGIEPLSLTARLEALHMGVTFLPSVLAARKVLRMRFAMGATVALRNSDLVRIGGFAALADYLADDYQLGAHIADLGLRVHMSDCIVNSVLGETTFREQWDREVRWAHCNRVSRPLEYPGLILTFSTSLAAVLLVATGFSLSGWLALGIAILLRWVVSWQVTGYTGSENLRKWLILLPLRDMFSTLVWCAGAVGRRVVWRGEEYILKSDGKLASPRPAGEWIFQGGCPLIAKRILQSVDAFMRRSMDIHEFSDDEKCILRLSLSENTEDMTLSDGTQIHRGEPIGELHMWNERIPKMPAEGPNLSWALAFQRQTSYSFRLLAEYIESHHEFDDVQAFVGRISFGSGYAPDHLATMARHWGFDVQSPNGTSSVIDHFVDFWANLYALGLMWAFNPGSLQDGRPSKMRRDQLWMSRRVLLEKYGQERRKKKAEAPEHTATEILWSPES